MVPYIADKCLICLASECLSATVNKIHVFKEPPCLFSVFGLLYFDFIFLIQPLNIREKGLGDRETMWVDLSPRDASFLPASR